MVTGVARGFATEFAWIFYSGIGAFLIYSVFVIIMVARSRMLQSSQRREQLTDESASVGVPPHTS